MCGCVGVWGSTFSRLKREMDSKLNFQEKREGLRKRKEGERKRVMSPGRCFKLMVGQEDSEEGG